MGAVQLPLPFIVQARAHVGPLPPPEQIAGYEATFPGAARWIFEEATKNAEHVRAMEQKTLNAQREDARLHRLLPFLVVMAFLGACTAIAIIASPVGGVVGIVATLGSVLATYLTGRVPKQRDVTNSAGEAPAEPPRP